MLKRVADQGGQRLPAFLATHPDPGNREERTRALATKAAVGKTNLVVRQRDYVKGLDGVVFGRDPRQGYFEGSRYFNPELRFQMVFPEGWKTQDSKSAVMAQSPDQNSQMQMTITAKNDLSPSAYVASLQRSGRIVNSSGSSENIGGYAAWAGRVLVQDASGKQGTLVAVFIRPSADLMFQILGQTSAEVSEDEILRSARSFRELTDPGRLSPTPDRVKVITAQHAGDFLSVVQAQGAQAVGIEETAILNNTFPDQPINAGELFKIVIGGRRR
jgi:predicted Zn-dependent protease